MLSPVEILSMAERRYPTYLRSLVTGQSIFPLRIRFGVPSTTDEFAKLQKEVTALVSGNFGYTIEWVEKKTRKWGFQRLPVQVRFDDEQQFLAALCKHREVEAFRRNIRVSLVKLPQLNGWLASHVKWVLEFTAVWDGMLAVCEYFLANPCPNLFARQLPIQVHTKFIEENSQVLTSMLTELLPEKVKKEGGTFEERFGLKRCQPLIRFKLLDPALVKVLNLSHRELGLPLSDLRKLSISGLCVIITENLMNFECLPAIDNGLAIFGHGNAAELLTNVDWLGSCDVHYWGDIDEHGFHILSRLREKFPGIKSMLMDSCTLGVFRSIAGVGERAGRPPMNLSLNELNAYKEVALHRLRIEQEKIPQNYLHEVLKLINSGNAISK